MLTLTLVSLDIKTVICNKIIADIIDVCTLINQ